MVQYCCVPLCKGYGGIHFPKDRQLRDKWRVAVNKAVAGKKHRLWEPTKHDIVCHLHFKPEDYSSTSLGERKRLKKDVVPSLFPERYPELENQENKDRKQKRQERIERRSQIKTEQHVKESVSVLQEIHVPNDVQMEVEISAAEADTTVNHEQKAIFQTSTYTQCELLKDNKEKKYSVENYQEDNKAIKYYTGFETYDHYMMFFDVLGPAAYHLDFKCSVIPPKDQLFVTLIKLRQNKDDYELALYFKVSQSTISNIVNTWINFMYFQLKEIDFWPSKENVQRYMPEDFKRKFSSTRVILDATENPIQKPSNVSAQSATFSTYKHKNTLKTMIGITPNGLVSYVSPSYGGSTSDRQIIERSDLCKKNGMFDKHDSIMADRGIMVQDLFATKDVRVNTPTMLSGKSQLDAEVVVKDRRVASKRIHVERVIGLAKQFKILRSDLNHSRVNLGSRIVFVCFTMLNFRQCIVGRLA